MDYLSTVLRLSKYCIRLPSVRCNSTAISSSNTIIFLAFTSKYTPGKNRSKAKRCLLAKKCGLISIS